MFYSEEAVDELEQLYCDIDPEGEWDLSLSSLRQVQKMLRSFITVFYNVKEVELRRNSGFHRV